MFGTSGVRGPVGDEVTAALAVDLGRAVTTWGADVVVLGHDPRTTSPFLADAVAAGVRECGGDVLDLGLAATPTVARSVAWRGADAGISVTASHNPPGDNGFKFWNPSGQAFDAEQRDELTALVESGEFDLRPWDSVGERTSWDGAHRRHVDAVVDAVEVDEPLSVVVDVGNGAGQVTADALLALGCEVETINAQPDGRFPGRPSEPKAENCTSLSALVGETDADLGVAHDGDADRMRAVDETGRFVSGDELLAAFGRAEASRGDRVAVPVDTSRLVDDALDAVGASATRTRVGDVFVAERVTESGVVFGGEPSGAWIWPDETLCPDGSLAAAKLVELVSREGALSAYLDAFEPYPLRRENVTVERKRDVMRRVETAARSEFSEDSITAIDGVRVDFDDGWILVRASGTQPLIRITAEAGTEKRVGELQAVAERLVEDGVDAVE